MHVGGTRRKWNDGQRARRIQSDDIRIKKETSTKIYTPF